MRTTIKILLGAALCCASAFAQLPPPCISGTASATAGQVLTATSNGQRPTCDWEAGGGGGGGSVTSVTIAGTTNQISITGTCTGTTIISCTLSLPSGLVLPGTVNGLTLTTAAGATITIAAAKVLTVSKTLTFTGTDGVTITFPATSATMARTDAANTFTGIQTFNTPIAVASGGTGLGSGTSGGVTCYTGSTTIASSAAIAANAIMIGGGAGACPSGTTAIPNGTTVTTQSQADNSTKPASTAYVDTGLATKQAAFGNQSANTIYAGPSSGGASAPGFRALVAADVTTLPTGVNGVAFSGLATGLMKNTTGTGVQSIAAVGDVTGLFTGTCPAGTTSVLGTGGVNQCIEAFPNAHMHGSIVAATQSASNTTSNAFTLFTSTFSAVAQCSGIGTGYSLAPVSGWLRNPTAMISAIGAQSITHVGVGVNCDGNSTFDFNKFNVNIPPLSAAGGYTAAWSSNGQGDQVHVGQGGVISLGIWRATATSNFSSAAGEFISDDGTADTILGWGLSAALNASSTQYTGFAVPGISSTEAAVSFPIPVAGTLKNFCFTTSTSPTNGVTVTVMKNTSTTTLTASIVAADAGGSQYCDYIHTVSVAAGDAIDIQTVSGASTQANLIAGTLLFVPNDGLSILLWGNLNNTAQTTTKNFFIPFGAGLGTTETAREVAMPFGCTLSNLYIYQQTANGGGITTAVTLRANEADTTLTGTVPAATSGSILLDGTHQPVLTAGNRISLAAVSAGGTAGAATSWSAACK